MEKERFVSLFRKHIQRDGAEDLLNYLLSPKSDFFEAPCSTRFHLSEPKGLVKHSLNVYDNLLAYMNRPRVKEVFHLEASDESIAIVALLHDVCKVNVYHQTMRNQKQANGTWTQVPSYTFDDALPYGHGEKSVYIISGFMKLTRQEAFAIRYHMGFSGHEDALNVGKAFQLYPLAFALSVADMEATYFLED